MTWAAGVRREIISDRARSSSSTPDGASGVWGGDLPHLRWGRAGPRLQTLRAAMGWTRVLECACVWRPATPRCQGAARDPLGALWHRPCVDRLSLHPPHLHARHHQQQHRTAPHYEHLRHRSAPHRARASIGRRGRLSLHSSYIKRPRSSSLQGASVCAPTDRPQRTSLQRQRRRRPRVGHRHAPEGEKENPRLARNGSEERTKGKESARLKRGRPAAPRPRRPRRVSGRRDGGAAPFSRCTRRRRSGTPR